MSILHLGVTFVRGPMGKKSHRLRNGRPVRQTDASHDLHRKHVGESFPRKEAKGTDPFVSPKNSEASAGSSSSTVQMSPPDVQQEEDGELSHLVSLLPAGHTLGGANEREPAGEETNLDLSGWNRPRRQEGDSPEEQTETSIPSLVGALQEQEPPSEGRKKKNPGTSSSINTDRLKYVCLVCVKTFYKYRLFSSHVRIHTGRKRHKCPLCDKNFGCHSDLKRHKRIHKEKHYECPVCRKRFSRRETCFVHQRIHTGEKPFSCLHCSKSFAQRANLNHHLRIHTGEKPFECSLCRKRFSQKGHLFVHQRVHTGEKPFSCLHCSKSFAQKSNLKKHLIIHTGEKPYKCSDCGNSFKWKEHLVKHQRIHIGEKPYKYSLRGKTFTHRYCLRRREKN